MRRVRGLTLNVQTVLASFNRDDLPEITGWVKANFPELDFHSFELLRPPFPRHRLRRHAGERAALPHQVGLVTESRLGGNPRPGRRR